MNKVSFAYYTYIDDNEDNFPYQHVEIFIDKKPLKWHLAEYEKLIAKGREEIKSIGNYEAIDDISVFNTALFSLKTTRIFPYQCAKDLTSDWSISFEMKIRFPYVIWDNFKLEVNPINKNEIFTYSHLLNLPRFEHPQVDWDYSKFGPLKFSFFQFLRALRTLK